MKNKSNKVTSKLAGLLILCSIMFSAVVLMNQYDQMIKFDANIFNNYYVASDLGEKTLQRYYDAYKDELTFEEIYDKMLNEESEFTYDKEYYEDFLTIREYRETAGGLEYELVTSDREVSTLPKDVSAMFEDDITAEESEKLLANYYMIAKLKFDENGNITVIHELGSTGTRLFDTYADSLYDEGIKIKDADVILAISKAPINTGAFGYEIARGYQHGILKTLPFYLIGISLILVTLVFAMPYKTLSQLRTYKVMTRLPLEFTLLAIPIAIVLQLIFTVSVLMIATQASDYKQILLDTLLFDDKMVEQMILGINYLSWISFFTLLVCSLFIVKEMMAKGLGNAIKEHSLIVQLVKKLFISLKQLFAYIAQINFNEPYQQRLLAIVGVNFIIISILNALWFFGIVGAIIYSVVIYVLLSKVYTRVQQDYKILVSDIQTLAAGQLDKSLNQDYGIFNPIKKEIADIQKGFATAVREEVKSQNMKTELVANVSHDLKTPLTSIVTYVDLLKTDTLTDELRQEYLDIIDRKAERLRVLIEDLFEMSKATSGNITLNLEDVNIVALLKQTVFELEDNLTAANIMMKQQSSSDKVMVKLDSMRTYRVFENLVLNICKYSLPNSRAYIEVDETQTEVYITFKNISSEEITQSSDRLKERFVRGDQSRTTEGSGLGLAICESFVTLQGGRFDILIDGDLFKVMIVFPK